jgi:hypothetical protein
MKEYKTKPITSINNQLLTINYFVKRTQPCWRLVAGSWKFFLQNEPNEPHFQLKNRHRTKTVYLYSCIPAYLLLQNEPNFPTPSIDNIQFPIYNRKNEPNFWNLASGICFKKFFVSFWPAFR